jgi:thiol-disulfide isomerase/thioredoxin
MDRRDFNLALASTLGLSACRGDNSYQLIGKQLPSIKGVYVDGKGFELSSIRRPAVIRFWGMWCGPCMIDMPHWFSAVRKMRALTTQLADLTILTIHVGEPPANGSTLSQWAEAQDADVATPVVNDANYAIMKAVGITGTPSTIYVNTNGKIEEHAWQFKNARGEDHFIRKIIELKARG